MSRKFKAVLFDMDGTLLDSMKYHIIAWKQAFAESGYYPEDIEFYLNEGVKHPITVRDRLKKLGIDNPDEETVKRIYTRKREIFDETDDLPPTEGVLELLDMLKNKVKLGVVTGGIRSVVDRVLASFFDGYFDVVVDYDSTEKGKPEPDPYLYGAKLPGIPKEHILAIENAPTGIESAVSAGLTCWAVCTTLEPRYLSKAHRVFKDFKELKNTLAEIF